MTAVRGIACALSFANDPMSIMRRGESPEEEHGSGNEKT